MVARYWSGSCTAVDQWSVSFPQMGCAGLYALIGRAHNCRPWAGAELVVSYDPPRPKVETKPDETESDETKRNDRVAPQRHPARRRPGRRPIGDRAMSVAERLRRMRAKRKGCLPSMGRGGAVR